MAKITVPEVNNLIDYIYEKSFTGCCLHITLDDYNIEDSSIRFCLKTAKEVNHLDCYAIGLVLLTMSKTQRLKLARNH